MLVDKSFLCNPKCLLIWQDLKSVAAALQNPLIHCTAFQVRPERTAAPAEAKQNASSSGRHVSKDETVLRIDVREFDALHVTHQVFI